MGVAPLAVPAAAPLPEDAWAGLDREKPAVVAANKSDLACGALSLERIGAWGAPVVATSGVTGEGIEELSRALGVHVVLPDVNAIGSDL